MQPDISSEQVGKLSAGLEIVATERLQVDGVLRVRYDKGWVSETAKSGTPLLELVAVRTVAGAVKDRLFKTTAVSGDANAHAGAQNLLVDVVTRSRDCYDNGIAVKNSDNGGDVSLRSSIGTTSPRLAAYETGSPTPADVRKAKGNVDKLAKKSKTRRSSVSGRFRRASAMEDEKKAMQHLISLGKYEDQQQLL